jgi:hypothetical protein
MYDKGVVQVGKDFILIIYMVDLFEFNNFTLLEHLEGNIFPSAFIFSQLNSPEGT